MVDGKEIVITPQEMDEFFDSIIPPSRTRIFTYREQAIILEGYRRNVNKDELALKLHTSSRSMKRWYLQYQKDHGL